MSAASSAFAEPRGARPKRLALLWLAIRLATHVRPATMGRLAWLAAGLAVAGGPLIVLLAAGLSAAEPGALPASTGLSLALAACPGVALALWAARNLALDRSELTQTLRQVGAERTAAWLLPALRIIVSAALGASAGAIGQGILRTTLFRALPDKAPLRTTLDAVSGGTWIIASAGITVLLVIVALLASGAGHRMARRVSTRFGSRSGSAARAGTAEVSAS